MGHPVSTFAYFQKQEQRVLMEKNGFLYCTQDFLTIKTFQMIKQPNYIIEIDFVSTT